MRALMIVTLVTVVCVSYAQMPDNGQTVMSQLYVNWDRPLTDAERHFLSTVPDGCDAKGQSFRKLIEICFRTNIAHAESAPRYGWRDADGVTYDYAYYCRLLQPADAPHVVRLPAQPKLPEFHPAGLAPDVPLLKLEGAEAPCTNMIKERKVGVAVGVETLEATPLKLEGAEAPCTNMIKQNETFVLCDVFGGTIRMPYQAGAVAPRVEARGAQMYERPGKDEYLPIGNVWAGHSHEGPCRKDGTCGDGSPPVKPGTGDGGGPGNGEVDNGLGAPGGYTRPGTTAPPETPAWWGPTSPLTHGSGPAIPDPGTSPARPA